MIFLCILLLFLFIHFFWPTFASVDLTRFAKTRPNVHAYLWLRATVFRIYILNILDTHFNMHILMGNIFSGRYCVRHHNGTGLCNVLWHSFQTDGCGLVASATKGPFFVSRALDVTPNYRHRFDTTISYEENNKWCLICIVPACTRLTPPTTARRKLSHKKLSQRIWVLRLTWLPFAISAA